MNGAEWKPYQDVLASFRDDTVDAALAADVRAGVLARIERERRVRRVWIGVAALLLAGLGGALLLPFRAPSRVAYVRKQPVATEPAIEAKAPAPRPRAMPRAVKPRPEPAPEPMKIQMLTDDPDIVIIWLAGDEGGF